MRLLGLSPLAVATPAMRAVWDDRSTLQAMLDVEAALARATARCGLTPDAAVAPIAAVADAALYDLDAIADGALRAGTPTIPLVKAMTAEVRRRDPASAGALHLGATSQDIADTGLVLQLRSSVRLVAAEGARLMGSLRHLVETHAATPLLGRTLMQPGPPVTLGLKAAGWLDAIGRGLDRIAAAADAALVLQFGGAVGTLAALEGRGLDVAKALGEALGLPVPAAPWHTQRDRLVTLAAAVAILGGSLGKMARDLGLMAQAELGEVAEPGGAGRGGSSTMPHKRNPVASIVALAAANRLPGLLASLVAGMVQEHERAAGGWQAEAAVHAELMLALSGSLDAMNEAIGGLRVDAAAMAANVERLRGLVLAERLMLRLAPDLGRDHAHHLVERLVSAAAASGAHLRDVAAADPDVARVVGGGLPALFDPSGYVGHAQDFIDRVLRSHSPEETRDAVRDP